MDDRKTNQLVVVGASSGGVEALKRLVTTVPAGFPAPIVIAQHLDPGRASHLQDILAVRGPLPVVTLADQQELEPGVIYVAPPNTHVRIVDHWACSIVDPGSRPMPSIDLLFSSAAEIYGEDLVAVVLSGTGSDGAAGARDVKAAGGTVVIQDPATARFPGMTLSLAPTTVDIVASLDSIGMLLHNLLTGVRLDDSSAEDQHLQALLDFLRSQGDIDFSSYKKATIRRRLHRRMVSLGIQDLGEYVQFVQRTPQEYSRLVSSFLVKVTEFFRDQELFDYLRSQILPGLIEEARQRGGLRIWSAGCATGEEAYSIAMLVADLLPDDIPATNVRIFATDLDGDAVAFARRGLYPAASLASMPPGPHRPALHSNRSVLRGTQADQVDGCFRRA
jgi:two-component system CheB/CheR fusion protein